MKRPVSLFQRRPRVADPPTPAQLLAVYQTAQSALNDAVVILQSKKADARTALAIEASAEDDVVSLTQALNAAALAYAVSTLPPPPE